MRTLRRLASFAILLGVAQTSLGITVDLTSGTTGTAHPDQSFNETRGVTATLLGSTDISLLSMSLNKFNIDLAPGGTVGARVYSLSGALLASADSSVAQGNDQSITIPIFAALTAGTTYRFAFFIRNGVDGGSADLFDPDPQNAFGFSYVDSSGLFRLTDARADPGDVFPATPNIFVPRIVMEVRAVPEPASFWCFLAGLIALAPVLRRRAGVSHEV
jgi:hypothetical protein